LPKVRKRSLLEILSGTALFFPSSTEGEAEPISVCVLEGKAHTKAVDAALKRGNSGTGSRFLDTAVESMDATIRALFALPPTSSLIGMGRQL